MEDLVLLKCGMLCLILCFSHGKANEERIDMVDFLLGRMYKINERLDNMEQKIVQKDAPKPTEPSENRHIDLDAFVNDINFKTSKMLKAFGNEKKHLHTKIKELFEASNLNTINTIELNRTLSQAVGKIDTVDSVLNQFKSQLENNQKDHKEAFQNVENGINEEISELTKEIRGFRKAVDNVSISIEQLKNQNEQHKRQINDNSEQIEDLDKDIDSTKLELQKISCSPGWERQIRSCILYVTDTRKSWSDAQNYCRKKGAVLAEPYSHLAFDLLHDSFPKRSGRFWIGGNDINSEGSWVWASSGRTVRLDRWLDGEPNNDRGDEDCMELIYEDLLNDLPCGDEKNFICEIKDD